MVRNAGHTWWNTRNGAFLDRIEIVDYGTDPTAFVAAIEAGEVDMLHQTTGDYVELMDSLGSFEKSQVVTTYGWTTPGGPEGVKVYRKIFNTVYGQQHVAHDADTAVRDATHFLLL